jgi:hypothetical protein
MGSGHDMSKATNENASEKERSLENSSGVGNAVVFCGIRVLN